MPQETLPPGTIRMPEGLTPFAQQQYVAVSKAMADLHARDPNADFSLAHEFLRQYAEGDKAHSAMLDEKKASARAAGVVPDEKWLRAKSIGMRNEFVKDFIKQTMPKYPPEAQEAWKKIARDLDPVTLPEIMLKQFHNEKKGGVQWAGIVGGLLGGLFVFNKLGGLGAGPLGFIATALAVVSTAWLANKGTEAVNHYIDKYHGDKDKGKAAAEKSKQAEVQIPKHDITKIVDFSKLTEKGGMLNIRGGEVTDIVDGVFSPGITPAKTAANTTTKPPGATHTGP